MTTVQETIQQPLLSNGSANINVSMATGEHSNNGTHVFYVVPASVLPGPVSSFSQRTTGVQSL
jgi:hypothetical protein